MSSYLLDTTGNTAVTYGQGKYVASSSSELASSFSWQAFNKLPHIVGTPNEWTTNFGYASGVYTGSVTTVDTLGIAYTGEWIQLQNPVSYILSSYSIQPSVDSANSQSPVKWWVLGSRDGLNWTLVDSRSGITVWTNSGTQSFTVSATQAYNYFRLVANQGISASYVSIAEWTLNGTEESLCITNDAKVGVGIANPQRSLEVAGDLVVGGTISGGAGMGGFRNRIINGDMRIAQRGTSNVLVSDNGYNSAYLNDRWSIASKIATGTVTQFQSALAASDAPYQLGLRNYMNVYVNSACTNFTYFQPGQVIEGYNIQDFNWGTSFGSPVTLSFWFRTNGPSGSIFNIGLRNYNISTSFIAPFTVANSGTWQYYTVTIPPPPNGTSFNTGASGALEVMIALAGLTQSSTGWIASTALGYTGSYNWLALAGNYIHFTGVQLEKGLVASPFEFRNYAQELALCQTWNNMAAGTGSTTLSLNTNGGNVGIGITNPGYPLDVVSGSTSLFRIQSTNNPASMTISTYNDVTKDCGIRNSNGGLDFTASTTSGAATFNFYAGSSGAYTTRYGGFNTAITGGATTLSVDASGYIIRTPSDERLKTNIQVIPYGLDTVNTLRPVCYEWKSPETYGTGRQVGMIAQEVQQIIPECVSGSDTLSLDYQKLVPVLTKAIQELSARLAALEQQRLS
jgi:hypothetical protein